MTEAKIYKAMNGVMSDIGAVAKKDTNDYDNYKYRGIDAVYNAVQPALIKNGVFVVPRLLWLDQSERTGKNGTTMIHAKVRVNFTFYTEDGSSIECEFPGEAIDRADKSINKAMTAAYKYCIFETFCIPTEDLNDADAESPEAGKAKAKKPEAGKAKAKKTAMDKIEEKDRKKLDKALLDKGIEPRTIFKLYKVSALEDLTYVHLNNIMGNLDNIKEKQYGN